MLNIICFKLEHSQQTVFDMTNDYTIYDNEMTLTLLQIINLDL